MTSMILQGISFSIYSAGAIRYSDATDFDSEGLFSSFCIPPSVMVNFTCQLKGHQAFS